MFEIFILDLLPLKNEVFWTTPPTYLNGIFVLFHYSTRLTTPTSSFWFQNEFFSNTPPMSHLLITGSASNLSRCRSLQIFFPNKIRTHKKNFLIIPNNLNNLRGKIPPIEIPLKRKLKSLEQHPSWQKSKIKLHEKSVFFVRIFCQSSAYLACLMFVIWFFIRFYKCKL